MIQVYAPTNPSSEELKAELYDSLSHTAGRLERESWQRELRLRTGRYERERVADCGAVQPA